MRASIKPATPARIERGAGRCALVQQDADALAKAPECRGVEEHEISCCRSAPLPARR